MVCGELIIPEKGRSLLFYFQKWCNPLKYKVFNKKRSVRLDTTVKKVRELK